MAECPTLQRRCGAQGAHVASSMVDEELKGPLTPHFNSRNGIYGIWCRSVRQSGLAPENFTTLAHFSISAALSLP